MGFEECRGSGLDRVRRVVGRSWETLPDVRTFGDGSGAWLGGLRVPAAARRRKSLPAPRD